MRPLFAVAASLVLSTALPAQPPPRPAGITAKTAGMTRLAGYFPLYWEEKAGKLWLEIDRWETELLYVNSLPAGVGSNDIGLDRGQLGRSRIVRFERSGPKVLLVQPNYGFRAESDNSFERRAVEEAFAQSVLWGFTVDAHDVGGALQRARQGTYRVDPARSAIYLARGAEAGALVSILERGRRDGLAFISDADARPAGGAHPTAHLWDDSANAVDQLAHMMAVRDRALERFSETAIREGAPMATMEEALVPVYLGHRYQVEAAAKVLGGAYYTYAVRGDGQKVTGAIPGVEQWRALDALLGALHPERLALPEKLLAQIPPRAYGYGRHRELFGTRTSPAFDPLGAAEAAATVTLSLLLDPERAARLVEHHARDGTLPGLGEVLERVVGATWKARAAGSPYLEEVRYTVDQVALYYLMALAAEERALPQARALALQKLEELGKYLSAAAAPQSAERRAHLAFGAIQIKRFLDNPKQLPLPRPPEPPPGQPIGEDCGWGEPE